MKATMTNLAEQTNGTPAAAPSMNAVVRERYGEAEVLEVRTMPRPTPGPDQVLLRVLAAGINPAEYHLMTGTPFLVRLVAGIRRPKDLTLGLDVCGVVEAVGASVTTHQVGDTVYGAADGSYAEFAVADAARVNRLSADMIPEQGAGVAMAAVTALQGLRDKLAIEPAQQVLINGASGGVGTFAVQIAKSLGAEVTGVCSARNVELVRSLGADHVIDYTETDFTDGPARYDAILDNVGSHSFRRYRNVLNPGGAVAMVGGKKDGLLGPIPSILSAKLQALVSSHRAIMFVAEETPEALDALHDLFEQGALRTVVDRTYPLSEAAEAMRYLATQRARGKVILVP